MRSLFLLALIAFISSCSSETPPPAGGPQTEPESELQKLVWVDRSGAIIGDIGQPQEALSGLEVSPDGERVVVRGREAGNDDIYIHEGDTKIRFTHDEAHARHPKWSPNGDRIAFFSYRNGAADLFVRASDGSGEDAPVAAGPMHEYYPDWTPDGETLVFHLHDTDTDDRNIWYAPVNGESPPEPLVEAPYNVGLPRFSPDGAYVAYQAEQDGAWNVHITTFPDGDETWQISTNGGVWPKWSGEGDELYYFENDKLMVVSVALGGEPIFGDPRQLFDTSSVGGWSAPEVSLFNALYGPAPNSSRFAIVVR